MCRLPCASGSTRPTSYCLLPTAYFLLPTSYHQVRFWAYETQNLAYALCCTFLSSPVKRDEPEAGRDWFLAIWSVAQFVKLCEFMYAAMRSWQGLC